MEEAFKEKLTNSLLQTRNGLIAYLELKVKVGDWHGVADAAMDLREVDAKLEVLKMVITT